MPADFQIIAGTHKTLVPKAFKEGQPVGFPAGSIFAWSSSDDPTAPNVSFDDVNAVSPTLTGVTVTDPTLPVNIKMFVVEDGFEHTMIHTVDVLPAAVDTIDAVDFDLT